MDANAVLFAMVGIGFVLFRGLSSVQLRPVLAWLPRRVELGRGGAEAIGDAVSGGARLL